MKKQLYYLSVGEPWNFETPDGQNIVKGEIIKNVDDNCLIFQSNHILQFDNIKGNILVLSPRYKKPDFSSLSTEDININGGVLTTSYENLTSEELFKDSKFVIIGSVRKYQYQE